MGSRWLATYLKTLEQARRAATATLPPYRGRLAIHGLPLRNWRWNCGVWLCFASRVFPGVMRFSRQRAGSCTTPRARAKSTPGITGRLYLGKS